MGCNHLIEMDLEASCIISAGAIVPLVKSCGKPCCSSIFAVLMECFVCAWCYEPLAVGSRGCSHTHAAESSHKRMCPSFVMRFQPLPARKAIAMQRRRCQIKSQILIHQPDTSVIRPHIYTWIFFGYLWQSTHGRPHIVDSIPALTSIW